MDISWTDAAKTLPAVVPAAATIIGLGRGPGALRSRLRHDVELVEKLPADSTAQRKMLSHIESQIDRISKLETEASRDVQSLVLALIFAPTLGILTLYLADRDHWLAWAAAVFSGLLALVFVYGIFESAQRVPRDQKGHRI